MPDPISKTDGAGNLHVLKKYGNLIVFIHHKGYFRPFAPGIRQITAFGDDAPARAAHQPHDGPVMRAAL